MDPELSVIKYWADYTGEIFNLILRNYNYNVQRCKKKLFCVTYPQGSTVGQQ